MEDVSPDDMLIHSVMAGSHPLPDEYRDILKGFASGVDVVDMNSVSPERNLSVLERDSSARKDIEKFVRCADLGIGGFMCLGSEPEEGEERDPALSPLRSRS